MNSLNAIAMSGLNVALMRADASGNNIANAQTPGYRRETVVPVEAAGGGVSAMVAALPQGDGLDRLAADMVEQMSSVYLFKANLQVVKTHDQMLGALLDLRA
jgi:flagellar hook protein FlgE